LRLEDGPEVWLESPREKDALTALREGHHRFTRESLKTVECFPFLYLPGLASKIFHESVSQTQITSQRDILNCYFTAYFNAWLDNQNLYVGGKKYVVSFTPRLSIYPESIGGFFGDYPDGKFISIVRNPKDWFVSARKHASGKHTSQIYSSVESAINQWMTSTSSSLSLAKG
jgi:hypothetical protein